MNPAAAASLLICFLALFACQPESTSLQTRSAQSYRVPTFEDSSTFSMLHDFEPVVRQTFLDYVKQENAPSIAYAVVAGDKMVISGSSGQANLEEQTAASTTSLYRIASMSKSFTAMAILKLRDEGKLALSDPVSKLIPEFSRAGSLTVDAPAVTVFDLLTMSAGFPEDNPVGDWWLDDTDEDVLELLEQGLSFSNVPGIRFEYSNLGYTLLGLIIKRVSGIPYQQYIRENILRSLGMNDTHWEYADLPSEKLALGYAWEDEKWETVPMLHDGVGGAMGGMITSVEDFSKYMIFHLSAWPPGDSPDEGPLKRSSLREMQQCWRFNGLFPENRTRSGAPCPSATGYGFGLGWRRDCNGVTRISHSGGLPGFGSIWAMYPDYGIAVVAFSNHTYGAPGRPSLVALDTLIQLTGLKPRRQGASEILNRRKDQLLSILSSWQEADSTVFAGNFFLDRSLENWRKHCAQVFEKTGEITEVSTINPENQLRGTFMLEGEKATAYVYFTLTPDASARVQALELEIQEE